MASEESHEPKRIFISYARSDGEAMALRIQRMLEQHDLEAWLDHSGLEGGEDWWRQAAETIDRIEHLVLVLTPAALVSANVEKEWNYARTRGVQVSPIRGVVDLDDSTMPRWMRVAHRYNLDRNEHRIRFLRGLEGPPKASHVPFIAALAEPSRFTERPEALAQLKQLLLDTNGDALAVTAMLNGPGGFGKSALAERLCSDPAIRDAFYDGILWVTVGERPGDLSAKLADLAEALTGKRPGAIGRDAVATQLAQALDHRRCLLVVDDVWSKSDLDPFLRKGWKDATARLVVTRTSELLPPGTKAVTVDVMTSNEATALLRRGLSEAVPGSLTFPLEGLAKRLGYWALLLEQANGILRRRVDLGQDIVAALNGLELALERHGLTNVLQPGNATDRNLSAIGALEVSIEHLKNEAERERMRALAIFAEGAPITLASVARLWDCDGWQAEELCIALHNMSLLQDLSMATGELRLHDVVRQVLREQLGPERLRHLNVQFTDAIERGFAANWAANGDKYALRYLSMHLRDSGHSDRCETLLLDEGWMAAKLQHIGVGGVLDDYREALANLQSSEQGKGEAARQFRRAFLSRFVAPHINLLNQYVMCDGSENEWLQQHENELRAPFFASVWLLASGIAPSYVVKAQESLLTSALVRHEDAKELVRETSHQTLPILIDRIGDLIGRLLLLWTARVLQARSFGPFQATVLGLLPYRALDEPIAVVVVRAMSGKIDEIASRFRLGDRGATAVLYVLEAVFAILCDVQAAPNARRIDWTRILLRYEFERRVDGTEDSLLLAPDFVRRTIDRPTFWSGVQTIADLQRPVEVEAADRHRMLDDTVRRIFPE